MLLYICKQKQFKSRKEVCIMTKKEMFNLIATECSANEEIVAFCERQIELLDKKANSVNSKKVAEQKAIMEQIKTDLSYMNKPVSVTELMKFDLTLGELSNQKISAMLKKLVDNGEVVKTVEKRVSLFSLADIG